MNFNCDLFEAKACTTGVWIHADDCTSGPIAEGDMKRISVFVEVCGGDGVIIYVFRSETKKRDTETKSLLHEIWMDWDELERLK